jgi:hypothetical protein
MATLIGYARVSTGGQSVQRQVDELRKAGCSEVVEETASGADRRPHRSRRRTRWAGARAGVTRHPEGCGRLPQVDKAGIGGLAAEGRAGDRMVAGRLRTGIDGGSGHGAPAQ